MTETELYFGQTIPTGGEVTAEQWKQYSDSSLSKIFTIGYTTRKTTGHWYDPDKKSQITENTYVVTVLNKLTPALSKKIDSIVQVYKTLYQQQAILRVDKKVRKFKFL